MENNELQRGLNARQMQMIALGGTIGVGLFMGATSTIKWTGPSVILAYLIAGIFLFLIMRAMGEMIYILIQPLVLLRLLLVTIFIQQLAT